MLCVACGAHAALAEECQEGSGVLVTPISKSLSIEGGGTRIEDGFTIKNKASRESVFKIYAAPYTDDDEKNFTNENNFTQISRWIKFLDASGGTVDNLEIRVPACSAREVNFVVNVPNSIPDGGQYAVIFAESKNSGESDAVITSASRVGMLVYARVSGGETIRDLEITDGHIEKGLSGERTVISAGAKATNKGNIDVDVVSKMVVRNIFGHEVYDKTNSISLLPGSTNRKISDVWEDVPYLGLFFVDYTIEINGEVKGAFSQMILVLPLPIMVIMIAALIVVVVGAVLFIKKHHSRQKYYLG